MIKRKWFWVGSVIALLAVVTSIALWPRQEVRATGIVSISVSQSQYQPSYAPAYQQSIPEGQGAENQNTLYIGGYSAAASPYNWLAVSRRDTSLPVGQITATNPDGSPLTINRNSTNSRVAYVQSSNSALIIKPGAFSSKYSGNITCPSGSYNITSGNSIVHPLSGSTVANWPYANFEMYVYSTGATTRNDLYALEDVPQSDSDSHIHGIIQVKVKALVRQQGTSTPRTAATRIGIGASRYNGTAVTVNTTERWIETIYKTNPSTGLAWKWQDVNGLQAGISLRNARCYEVLVEVQSQVGSQTFYPITPTEVTVTPVNGWRTVNASALAPAGSTGVIIHIVNTSASSYSVGLRKNGSTDDRAATLDANCHTWAIIGVDANRIFQAYTEHLTNVDFYVVGYTVTGVTIATNATLKTFTAHATTFYDIDCSVQAPSATGLIFEIYGTDWQNFGIRKNGSTDARRLPTIYHNTFSAIVGCDTGQICEGQHASTEIYFYLTGYVTDGATFNTNATNLSLAGTGAWTDLTALPATSNMGFIEVASSDFYNYGLRKNGTSENIYQQAVQHPWGIVECDTSQLIEGEIANTGCDFFLVGYSTAAAATPDIGNTPTSKNFSTVNISSTYWANGATPPNPITDAYCTFTINNTGTITVNTTIKATDFTGGVGWILGAPDATHARMTVYRSADNTTSNGTALTTADQTFKNGLATGVTLKWDIKLETPTDYTDTVEKSSTITITATAA